MRSLLVSLVAALSLCVALPSAGQELPADAQQRLRAQQLYVRGLTQAQIGRPDAAIPLFREALRLRPSEPAVLMSLAEAHADEDELGDALFYAEQAHEHVPDDVFVTMLLARLLARSGELDRALTQYDALMAVHPPIEDAHRERARVLLRAGRVDEAAAAYEAALDAFGEDAALLQPLVPVYQRLDDDDALETTLRRLMRLVPDDAPFRMQLAALFQRQGREADAERLLSAAAPPADTVPVTDDATDTLPDATPGDVTTSLPDAAQEARLREAVARDADDPDALVRLAEARHAAGDPAEAAALWHRAADLAPRRIDAWHAAAAAYLAAGRPADALRVTDDALLLFPGQTRLLLDAGFAHLRLQQPERAAACYAEAADLVADDADPAVQAEVAAARAFLTAAGDPQGADRLLANAPASAAPRAVLLAAWASIALGRADAASDATAAALAAHPDDPTLLDAAAWAAFQAGDAPRAADLYRRAAATGRADALTLERYGDVLHALGETQQAVRRWQEALERLPEREALRRKIEGSSAP